jgi:EF-hand domain pair/EF hand
MRASFILLSLFGLFPAIAYAQNSDGTLLDRMAGADANHDGNITKPELIAFRTANFARIDRDGDGFMTNNDIPSFLQGRLPIDIPALTRQFDANKDGKVSRDEFVNGPTFIFDRADTNHDGVLTAGERKAAAAARANR